MVAELRHVVAELRRQGIPLLYRGVLWCTSSEGPAGRLRVGSFDDSVEDGILVEIGGGVHTRFASNLNSLKCRHKTTNFAV